MSDSSLPAAESARAHELVQAWLEQSLSTAGAEELISLIARFPELAEQQLDHLETDHLLRELSAQCPDGLCAGSRPSPGSAGAHGWGGHLKIAIGGLLLGVCLIIGIILIPKQTEHLSALHRQLPDQISDFDPVSIISAEVEERTTDAVAIVSRCLSVKLNGQTKSLEVGSLLSPGRIVLETGVLRIDLFSGVKIAMEAPCDLEIVSGNQTFCRAGKLTAQVPVQASGFRIDTPHGCILDLGTGFGVSVEPEEASVHVFKGLVELPDSGHQRVKEGHAISLADGKLLRSFPADEREFLTIEQVDELHARATEDRYQQWKVSMQQATRDPDLLVYFDFDQLGAEPSLPLLNRAFNSRMQTGAIVGCQIDAGRWPAQQALAFKNLSDRVRIDLPDECDAMTLTTWARVHSLPMNYAGLLMSDGMPPGGFHWQITREGRILLCFGNETSSPTNRAEAETGPLLTPAVLGNWLHFALIIDSTHQQARHYLNGQLVWEGPVAIHHRIKIGQASLGNWSSSTVLSYPIRNLCGVMGEFTIHRRILTSGEINAMYRAGDPNFVSAPSHQAGHSRPDAATLE